MKKIILVLYFLSVGAFSARAADVYKVIIEKQEKKKAHRWSLADWLETKEKMRMMDMWLAMNSSPYEYILSGSYVMAAQGANGALEDQTGYDGRFAAFASIFGLEAQYEKIYSEVWRGLFHFRLFGFQEQGTHLTLQAGMRQQIEGLAFKSFFTGGNMALYLSNHFGVEGLYRYYFQSLANATGNIYKGTRMEGGAFIDFSFLRIYGTYYSELLQVSLGSATSVTRKGVLAGAKMFF